MKKGLLVVVMTLAWVGVGLILFGMQHYQKLNDDWTDNYETIAAEQCEPDETFRVTHEIRGPKNIYNYFCDDPQGNSNNLIDEMDALSPKMSDLKWVFMGAGVMVLAGILAFFAVPRPTKNRDVPS